MAKKSFLDAAGTREDSNPALNFISEESIEAAAAAADPEPEEPEPALKAPTGVKPPKGYKLNPLYVETKSKRVQLVLQPSLYKAIRKASRKAGLSLNEYCHRILNEAIEREGK